MDDLAGKTSTERDDMTQESAAVTGHAEDCPCFECVEVVQRKLDAEMAGQDAAIILRREVHAEHHDGMVKVVRSADGEVLLTLSLAAAEDLSFGMGFQAEMGRQAAERPI